MIVFFYAFARFFNYIGAIAVNLTIFYTVLISVKQLANRSQHHQSIDLMKMPVERIQRKAVPHG